MKGYMIYMVLIILITVPAITSPILLYEYDEGFSQIQGIYSYACHQLTSRSYCFFPESGAVEDCYGTPSFELSKEWIVIKNGETGYKFPVCARDLAFYLFALIGGVFLSAINKHREMSVPNPLWLIIALIPFALDGTTQLVGLRESTNLLRFATGAVAGIVLPFYLVPMLNRFIR